MSKFCIGCMEQFDDELNICPQCGYVEDTGAKEALHMEPGSILKERYIVGKVLGFGGFGVTYIGWDATLEQKVAIKEYLPSEFSTRVPGQTEITIFNGDKTEQFNDGLSKFIEEAQRLAKFHNEDGIVGIFDSFEDNNTAYIIMECLQGETLSEYLKREKAIPVDNAIQMLLPVINSLQRVNEEGIIHRDIAPDNIFLSNDGTVKLIDFGAARFATTSHSRSLTVIIKPGYSPEEQYRSRGDQGSYTDVYAIGATLYRMITGEAPPDALERRAQFESKKRDILKPIGKFTKQITENQETAILNALNVRIEDRTQNMDTLAKELMTEQPEKVKRLYGKIKKIDILKWPTWAKITAPIAMCAVITLTVLFATGVIGFDALLQTEIKIPVGMSRVPSIVSNELPKAEERLESAVLLYSIIGKEYSDLIPADRILNQGTGAGSVVMNNTIIDVAISGAREVEMVPNVKGLSVEEAIEALEGLGFAVQTKNEYSNVIAAGGVISQDKTPNEELEIGEIITLTISNGVNPSKEKEGVLAEIPELIGLKYQEAIKAAEKAGFMLSIKSKEYRPEFEEDVVMFQSIDAGTEVLTGNTIEIIVSLGEKVIMAPDVQYKTEAEAIKLIADGGLTSKISYAKSETVASGLVISQTPEAKTIMNHGEEIAIVVSTGGESFSMPSVVGMTEENALTTLTEKGLSILVEYESNSSVPENNVIRQSVPAKTSTSRGSRVTITVSSGQDLVRVENIIGKAQSEAVNILKSQGFEVTVSETYSDTVAKGNAISQAPKSGSLQIKGSRVTIVVSEGKEPIKVPNVTNRTQKAAESAIKNLGLTSTVSEREYSDKIPANSVISQSPSGGNLYKGDTVSLVISKGKQDVRVQNVVGQTKSSAENTLKGQGFNVTIVEVYSNDADKGKVISQNPTSGTTKYRGDAVAITVSKGSDPDSYKISLKSSANLLVDSSEQLSITYTPSVTAKNITWTTSDSSVVTVSGNGLITGRKNGTATITAKASNGSTASCTVSVKPKAVESIEVNQKPTKIAYFTGDSLNTAGLSIKVNYNNKTVDYISSGFSTSPANGSKLNTVGTQQVSVTYSGKTLKNAFNVNVTVQTVTITFNNNGSITTKGVDKDSTTSLPTPTREGYTFKGWYTASSGGKEYKNNTPIEGNITLYARWERLRYKVTFNSNGGSSVAAIEALAGDAISFPSSPAKSYTVSFNANGGQTTLSNRKVDCTFKGWYTEASGGKRVDGAKYTPSKNVTLYAQWTNPNLGSLATPTWENGTSKGWFTAAKGGTPVASSTTVTGNMTVYAQWELHQYLVEFYNNSGSSPQSSLVTAGDDIILQKATKYYELSWNANNENDRSGSSARWCTFNGWYTASSGGTRVGVANEEYYPKKSIKLYAQWTNPNVGELEVPTRSGYAFTGWYTAASGGTKVTKNTIMTGNMTIYAQWELVRVSGISLSASSGNMVWRDTRIHLGDYTSSIQLPNTMSRLDVGATDWTCNALTFTATLNPATAPDTSVTVTSSDTSLVVVSTSRSGNVTTITLNGVNNVPLNGNRTVTINVRSNADLSISKSYTVNLSRPHSLTVTSNNKCLYVSGNPFSGGKVYGVQPGTGTLTVTSAAGSKISVNVTVTRPSSYTVASDSKGKNLRPGPAANGSLGQVIPAGTTISLQDVVFNASERRIWGYGTYNGKTGYFEMYVF